MIQRGEDFRFPLEPRQPVGIAGERLRQDFNATSRFNRVSRARYTSPIPPAPRGAMISYGPRRVPEARLICEERRIIRGRTSTPPYRGLSSAELPARPFPRSRHRPVAATEGSLSRNFNEIGVRLWTGCRLKK